MSLHFSVLASGSTGNAIYVATEEHSLLIDAGLSGKKMQELFEKVDKKIDQLSGILVTHEHSDHIKGLGVLARKYNLPIYANEKTWKAMDGLVGVIPTDQKFVFDSGSVKHFGGLSVESFGVSHDAAEPMFYAFHYGEKKLVVITDTGYVSDRMKGVIDKADMYVFESNHDVSMLQMGHYPWSIKRRILGDYGHVSNEDAAIAMADVISDKTKRIYLAHLSKDNNMKDLARMSVTQTLATRNVIVGEQVELYDTDPNEPTPLAFV